MRTPRVTVLLPVHNGAHHLREAVDSILAQTLGDFELLIVDDASEDDSVAVVESIPDPRIRLIRSERRIRLAGALNLGLREAAGELVARMDADDVSLPERLRKQAAYMEAHTDLGVCGTWVRAFGKDAGKIERYSVGSRRVGAQALFNTPFAHPTVMFRRDSFLDHRLTYDVSYYPTEDFDLWERALRCFAGDNLPLVLLEYRVHERSLTGSEWSEMDRQASRVCARRLADLGFEANDEETRFHRLVATAAVKSSRHEILRAEQWLRSILRANDARAVYDRDALSDIVAELWLRICMQATGLGWKRVRAYASSALSGSRRATGTLLCAFSALKASIGG